MGSLLYYQLAVAYKLQVNHCCRCQVTVLNSRRLLILFSLSQVYLGISRMSPPGTGGLKAYKSHRVSNSDPPPGPALLRPSFPLIDTINQEETSRMFTCFNQLPSELRLEIWSHAFPRPRVIELTSVWQPEDIWLASNHPCCFQYAENPEPLCNSPGSDASQRRNIQLVYTYTRPKITSFFEIGIAI